MEKTAKDKRRRLEDDMQHEIDEAVRELSEARSDEKGLRRRLAERERAVEESAAQCAAQARECRALKDDSEALKVCSPYPRTPTLGSPTRFFYIFKKFYSRNIILKLAERWLKGLPKGVGVLQRPLFVLSSGAGIVRGSFGGACINFTFVFFTSFLLYRVLTLPWRRATGSATKS